MKKFYISIATIILSFLLFFGGLVAGKTIYNKPTREVLIGYDNTNYPGQIDYRKKITDIKDQWTIDNLQQIFMGSKQIEFENITRAKPDVHIKIKSPKAFVTLTHSDIWFNEEGALIKIGEDDYRTINIGDAAAIKKMIDYKSP
ncbi:hypothetical protein PH210_28975 [Paenibacillus sp. BSR1-1]|uniref:hypothetical protein n=1 Tax=Paenibacillus sp. BSR1-1 TaxID=3020845 RepID=UPI0025AFA93A|nr:hypothetical protein [Paenibacillus sp. BSR1-1]MDN3020180.1 hypothetical protein [Paenibacillus sp. BSR1-1]